MGGKRQRAMGNKQMPESGMKDISIIDALPLYECPKEIFTVGAGHGLLELYLSQKMNYDVTASDIKKSVKWEPTDNLRFIKYDILKYKEKLSPIVICSQVLEHIKDYQTAFYNLIDHTKIRLIITFPYKYSFYSPDHINFWDDKSVEIFKTMAHPYLISISKIKTKPEDKDKNKWDYLLIIDKRQKYA